jgi:hypothetical protein
MSTAYLGQKGVREGCKSKAATVRTKQDCRKGLRMASKGSQYGAGVCGWC